MADNGHMKSIRDTFLYEMINKNEALDNIIKTMLGKGMVLTKEMMGASYMSIASYFKFPLKNSVLKAVEEGIVVPMMYPPGITMNYKVPTCLPFILMKGDGVTKAIAILDNYATFDKEGKTITIDANKLYCLLETAFIARSIQEHFKGIRHNTTIYNEATSIYAHMFTRILNKEYSLNVDKTQFNKVLFLASKFFMINLLQMEGNEDIIFNYASKTAGEISPIIVKRLHTEFDPKAYANISTFVTELANKAFLINSSMSKLTVREYVDKFIRTYSNAALFGLEHFSYFLFTIISTLNHAFLCNGYQIDEAMGPKSGEKLYGHLVSVLQRN